MSSNSNYIYDSSLYNEAYYNAEYNTILERDAPFNDTALLNVTNLNSVIDRSFLLVRFLTTLLLRIGFNLIQIANIATVRSANMVIKNLINLVFGSLTFLMLGIGIGQSIWIFHDTLQMADAIKGWSASTIASALILTLTNNRIPFFVSELIMFIFNTAIVPILILWTWTDDGFMKSNKLGSHNVHLDDLGGAICVHISGSLSGIVGIFYLGRRIIRLRDIEDYIFKTDSILNNILGYSFILPGIISLGFPTNEHESNELGIFFLNNIVASASSIIAVCSIQRIHYYYLKSTTNIHDYWTMVRFFQSGIAGCVSVTAGVLLYHPGFALLFGLLGGIVFYTTDFLIGKTYIEDNCNIIAIHYFCATLSIFFPPFFKKSILLELLWVFICWLVANLLVILISAIVYFTLLKLTLLRTSDEDQFHQRALILQANVNQKRGLQRLLGFYKHDQKVKPGDNVLSLFDPDSGAKKKSIENKISKKFKRTSESSKPTLRSKSDLALNRKKKPKDPKKRSQSELTINRMGVLVGKHKRLHPHLRLSNFYQKAKSRSLISIVDVQTYQRMKISFDNFNDKYNNNLNEMNILNSVNK